MMILNTIFLRNLNASNLEDGPSLKADKTRSVHTAPLITELAVLILKADCNKGSIGAA